jgi:hypothetical protein
MNFGNKAVDVAVASSRAKNFHLVLQIQIKISHLFLAMATNVVEVLPIFCCDCWRS